MYEKDFEHRLTDVENRSRSNTKRLDKMEKVQDTLTELARSVATIAQKQADMDGDMKEVKADVKTLAGKPGKRWESIVEKGLLTVVAAMVSWVLLRLKGGFL